ncbi:M43 family zinc metalloprotease, partial [uncultured Flavobacterium sp.]|uniref:M43 family zinc metalloprotease n=1 Tax=uncultured Flavobacterium sp. TaxID=165435 RepID=UPI0025D2FD5E
MKLISLLGALLLSCGVYSQAHECGTDWINQQYVNAHPEIFAKRMLFDQNIAAQSNHLHRSAQNQVYEIPVVVHIVHTGEAVGTYYNPSDAAIESWLDYTNDIFAATAPGFSSSAVIPVRFVLARRDQQCNATDGIVRVNASSIPQYAQHGIMLDSPTGADYRDVLELSRWDPHFYYNIYVVRQLGSSAGVAFLPGTDSESDGTFVVAGTITTNDTTGAHELGHSLGLHHVFGTATGNSCPPNQNCMLDNDMVCDTAPVSRMFNISPFPTNDVINPCSGVNYNNEQSNVMNYSTVKNNFTQGQSDRAIAQLLEYRQDLLDSNGELEPDGISSPVIANCQPEGTASEEGFEMGPVKVVFGNINNPSNARIGNTPSYIDYVQMSCLSPALSTSIHSTTPTMLQVAILSNDQVIAAYIDYNNNGIFDNDLELVVHQDQDAYTTANYAITPPASCVKNVPLRMRIISDFTTTV